jgi:3-dehydroquinate synthase
MSAERASAPAIVFIGFMGAGKSTALAAARQVGLETIEVDELMEREMGMPITEAFERFGEEGFREREAEVVGGLLERADGGAIALGGGSVLSPRIRAALDRHTVVWLQISATDAWRRIAGSDRPLATSAADVERLLATRLPLYAERLAPLAATVEVEPGEGAKTMAEAERVLRELARQGMTREDHLGALGGGVVGDLAGFCAASYQRGVPVVQVPTTLVAQVDSSIGGKTGVDLKQGKNYAGAYHQPAAVIADVGTLESLPREELAAGFVEVLKTGLLAGGPLWERARLVEELNPYELSELVFACARYKCEIVAADERDAGLRNALNLGHTVGHAIEVASDYAVYRHGEAVGIGLLAALRLSGAAELRDEVESTLARLGLPTAVDAARWAGAAVDPVLAALQRDKKRTAAGVGFVLLREPGKPEVGQLVPDDEVRASVEELLP